MIGSPFHLCKGDLEATFTHGRSSQQHPLKLDLVPWLVGWLVAIVSAKLIEGSWYIVIGGIAGSLARMALAG